MKLIPLTQGKNAIVDDEDFEFLSQWKWYCDSGYAIRQQHIGYVNGKQKLKCFRMHRVIMQTPAGICPDHINGNGLDNRRSNLRNCTRQQNRMNSKSNTKTASEYKGIRRHRVGTWEARIMAGGKRIQIGHFAREEDAAQAYNFVALELHGEFARFNVA